MTTARGGGFEMLHLEGALFLALGQSNCRR